jgi:signal transduction histidine kinase
MPSSKDKPSPESFDIRFIAAIRCLIALCVLITLTLDPLERTRFYAITAIALGLYVIYSALLYTAARQRHRLLPASIEPWVDAAWGVGLLGLSGDPNGIFIAFPFLAILIAAFQGGLALGLRIALVSAVLLFSAGMALAAGYQEFGLRHAAAGPAALVVLGYLAASFGEVEITLKRRLALLKDVSRFANPRFGVDRTIGMVVERLRTFYDADACLLVTVEPGGGGYPLRCADRQDPEKAVRAEMLPDELGRMLLGLPNHYAVIYGGRRHDWRRWHPGVNIETIDIERGTSIPTDKKLPEALAAMFDATAFITVPWCHPHIAHSRLYITARRRRVFDPSDVDFLLQVFEQTMPFLHNIKLVDQLASDAAEAERQRIALDLHDGVIQPYIGLQIGLAAIRQKLAWGDADVKHEIERLLELTKDEITQLRHMVQSLKHGGEAVGELLPCLRRFACKFAEATGIRVRIEATHQLLVNDHLASEVFHLVTEGLSNVRRHTQAETVAIRLAQEHGYLRVHIANDNPRGKAFVPFMPRSITARVTALGGRVHVECPSHSETIVMIEIPL